MAVCEYCSPQQPPTFVFLTCFGDSAGYNSDGADKGTAKSGIHLKRVAQTRSSGTQQRNTWSHNRRGSTIGGDSLRGQSRASMILHVFSFSVALLNFYPISQIANFSTERWRQPAILTSQITYEDKCKMIITEPEITAISDLKPIHCNKTIEAVVYHKWTSKHVHDRQPMKFGYKADTTKKTGKQPVVDLDEGDDDDMAAKRAITSWNRNEEILLAETWIEHSQDANIGKDQQDDVYWNLIMEDFNSRTTAPPRSTGGSQSESVSSLVSLDYRCKCDAAKRAYEAKREKELAMMQCIEPEFLMLDPSTLPPANEPSLKRNKLK
ncbi:hypothetical protein Tco_1318457 [Tanacetum coccineum]